MTKFDKIKADLANMDVNKFADWYLYNQLEFCKVCETYDGRGSCWTTDCKAVLIKYLSQEEETSLTKVEDNKETTTEEITEDVKEDNKEEGKDDNSSV